MRRRQFIGFLASSAASANFRPSTAQGQQGTRVIGYLAAGSQATFASRVAALRQGLAEKGYVEGRNVAIEFRFADGLYDRMRSLAAELVALKVDAIITGGPPA